MGCTGRCLEQRTTSASPDEADGELRRGKAVMVAVVMIYNVHTYCMCSLPIKGWSFINATRFIQKVISLYKDNFVTYTSS